MRLRKVAGSLPDLKPAAREILTRCDGLLVKILEENRRIAHNLRPAELDQLGLAVACTSFCDEIQLRTNLKFQCLLISPGQRLPPLVELHLFRIVQEAINNIEKHARAKLVRLQIRVRGDSVVLKIQDDGNGFDAKAPKSDRKARHGLGLTNMRERALSLDGTYEIISRLGKGTTIIVRVPLKNKTPKKSANQKSESLLTI
jgi:signal transduction histidine kinase